MVKTPINLEKVDQQLLINCRELLRNDDLTNTLKLLRKANYSKSDSMWILVELLDINFRHAQRIVHTNEIWADYFENDQEVNNQFFDFIEKLE